MTQAYYWALRTPDGPMVSRHDPGDREPLVFPAVDYDWGTLNERTVRLALALIEDVTNGFGHFVYPDTLAEEVLAGLPLDEWTMSCDALRSWLDEWMLSCKDTPF